MSIQLTIVLVIIVAAVAYVVSTLLKKRKAFSTRSGCETDCGCSGGSKKLSS
ncbi:MAG: FeoB-associated Cys-rich membrane protein [Pyrinomonadaceae bacterium]